MTPGPDVVTVGSLLVELTPTRPGETLRAARQYTLLAGGAAANAVFALARLGVRVRFITAVGDDEFGALAIDTLRDFGVETDDVRRVAGQLTPVSFCAIDGHGGKTFRFYRVPGHSAPIQRLETADFHAVTTARLFDFSEGSIRDAALRRLVFQAARAARAAAVPVLYACNLRRAGWGVPEPEIRAREREALALADIAVMNTEEAAFITEETPRQLSALGPRVLLVTNGGDGDIAVYAGGARTTVPPYRVPVVYDVGAGDTFHAGLVAAALQGNPAAMTLAEWAQTARFAAATAAIRVSTSADPADLPTAAQVRAWQASRALDCRRGE